MKSRAEEDRELVQLAQTGDSHAFAMLMRRYTPSLNRFLRRFMRNSDDVEDVIQETFIRAYLAINRFRSDSTFSTWIVRIGINAAKDSLALRQRQGPQLASLGDEDTDRSAGGPGYAGIQAGNEGSDGIARSRPRNAPGRTAHVVRAARTRGTEL